MPYSYMHVTAIGIDRKARSQKHGLTPPQFAVVVAMWKVKESPGFLMGFKGWSIMASSEILNALDMAKPRTVSDFLDWVTKKEEDLSAIPKAEQFIGSTLKTKFYDEIYPLSVYVKREYSNSPGVIITPNLNSDNFDATVTFKGLPSKVFIEITRAKNGHAESLRMEALARDGCVPWGDAGPIASVSGRKGAPNRVVEILPKVVDRTDELLAEHFLLVKTTVNAKAGGRRYGGNFILLVIVDDYDHFQTDSDHAKLDGFIRSNLLCTDLDFARLIIFGISGKLHLSYNLPRYNTAML